MVERGATAWFDLPGWSSLQAYVECHSGWWRSSAGVEKSTPGGDWAVKDAKTQRVVMAPVLDESWGLHQMVVVGKMYAPGSTDKPADPAAKDGGKSSGRRLWPVRPRHARGKMAGALPALRTLLGWHVSSDRVERPERCQGSISCSTAVGLFGRSLAEHLHVVGDYSFMSPGRGYRVEPGTSSELEFSQQKPGRGDEAANEANCRPSDMRQVQGRRRREGSTPLRRLQLQCPRSCA